MNDDIPLRMRRRPVDQHGRPIPFSQFLRADGSPDFRILDTMKVRDCVSHRRCGMCGEVMGRHIFFVGGPICVANGIFNDPPMHRDCAVFALRACAHLNRAKGRYNTSAPMPADAKITVAKHTSDQKADHFALMHAHGYSLLRGRDGALYIRADLPWASVELWRDGRPMKASHDRVG